MRVGSTGWVGESCSRARTHSGVLATPGWLLSGELELWDSGLGLERQGRVRIRRLLCAQVKRKEGKQEDWRNKSQS